MSLIQQSLAISGGAVLLYLTVLGWALAKHRLLIGGCGMFAISILPVLWQAMATDSEAKGEGVLAALLSLPALLMIAAGGLMALARTARDLVRKRRPT
jgi:hypothetical protein